VRIAYRRWNMSDVESIRQLLLDTWMDTYSEFIPREDILEYLNEHYDTNSLRTFIDDQNVVGFIAEVDGAMAGYGKTFYNKEEMRLYVQQLYILPRFQGLGLGKQLMAFAAEHAKTFNLDRVWLGVMEKNMSALLWYQNMGYRIAEKIPFTMGKTQVDHYIGYVPIADIFQFGGKKQ
jgi:diamine N-acetyltransferase